MQSRKPQFNRSHANHWHQITQGCWMVMERTTSLAVTSIPTSLSRVWNETQGPAQCSSEYHLFHEIVLSQFSIELLLRHYWWHICLGDERERGSISAEQGSWSESLQQEVIRLADFKTYATSFSSLQPFSKRAWWMWLPHERILERGESHEKVWMNCDECHTETEKCTSQSFNRLNDQRKFKSATVPYSKTVSTSKKGEKRKRKFQKIIMHSAIQVV